MNSEFSRSMAIAVQEYSSLSSEVILLRKTISNIKAEIKSEANSSSLVLQVASLSDSTLWCKSCLEHLVHEICSFYNAGFDVRICAGCHLVTYSTHPPYQRKLAHNEHLVGIETNPGPKRKADEIAIVVNQAKHKKQKVGRVQSKRGATGLPKILRENEEGIGPVSRSYIEMLCDPINSEPLASGFMTWVGTVLQSAYVKGTFTLTADGCVIVVNPDASLSTNLNQTSILGNYMTNQQFSQSTPGTIYAYTAANQANIAAAINTNRVLASGIELEISHAATAQSGIISVTRLNGLTSSTSLDAILPGTLETLPQTAIYTTDAGNATIKCNWLPADATDFEFSNNTVYNNGEGILNPYVVTLSGFPTGTRVFYTLVTHLEGESGIKNAGSVIVDEKVGPSAQKPTFEPALIDEHPSADSFMRKSSDILSNASKKMEYAAGKTNQISDIVNSATKVYSALKSAYDSPLSQKVRGYASKIINGWKADIRGF